MKSICSEEMLTPINATVLTENEMISVEGGHPCIVFVAGVAVGYIVDGVVKYKTGKSCGDWVAVALKKYNRNKGKKLRAIYLPGKY